MRKTFSLLFVLILFGCSTITVDKTMDLKAGTSSDVILERFGKPDRVSVSTCGGDTGKPWQCTQWYYDNEFGKSGLFYFYETNGNLYLNNFTTR